MAREIQAGIGCFLGGAALSLLAWVIEPESISYNIRFGIGLLAIVLLIGAAWMLAQAWRTKLFHQDKPFVRSTGNVIKDEIVDGIYTHVIEKDLRDLKVSTITSVLTDKKGKEFIVEQHVQCEDGSTTTIKQPKD